jgi:hypothetical protein
MKCFPAWQAVSATIEERLPGGVTGVTGFVTNQEATLSLIAIQTELPQRVSGNNGVHINQAIDFLIWRFSYLAGRMDDVVNDL